MQLTIIEFDKKEKIIKFELDGSSYIYDVPTEIIKKDKKVILNFDVPTKNILKKQLKSFIKY